MRSNVNPTIRSSFLLFSAFIASLASAAEYPTPAEGDFTIRDFKFTSGETLPELHLHYRTLGKP
jgi:homoserine O-acetyltransferase